jgi:tetratricopeptide (TPR) repeat protein
MAFGFGFNKQKVLSAAEKYVQQGKIQNAIAEYEKVTKADPKDLTVTNTIGDLYSRLGEADKATECFKTVGDAYATQGFTVKAIAMYKKISKLRPSLEGVLKLAELYTQQGLFNDARAQYLQVAEEFLKSGELDNAVRIFQKILEMDPENTNMRVRLAEVYVRLGKKNDAWQIFSAAAETLRAKGNLNGAEEVLQRMLTLDPGNGYALLMQGRNLLQAGDAEAAIESLQKVPDLDSNPDGLRDLLKAYLKNGRLSDAGTLANKLLTVHNDLASIAIFADALMQAGQYENALQVYDQHADRLLAEDSDKVLKNLHSIIGHVRDNPASLEKLLELFQKAGESTHLTEVIELLAHASVQSGDLPRARDLYQKLASMEPGNTLHMNHYQQVVSQLGGPVADKLISAEEAAVIVDELEATSPSVHQHYTDAISLSVRAALTDAELFISYNMPAKALGPLMAALPQAPNDLRLNQRLAALHTRAARFGEAGVCCRTLQNVYSEAGYPEEATRYGELADRYEQRSAPAAAVDSVVEIEPAENESVAEEISVAPSAPWPSQPESADETEFSVVAEPQIPEQPADQHHPADHVPEPAAEIAAPAESEPSPTEIDLSSEWDDSLTIEVDTPPADAAEIEITDGDAADEIPLATPEADTPAHTNLAARKLDPEKTAESIEEIRFYLEHGMPEQASAAFEKLKTFTDDEATLSTLQAEIEAGPQDAPPEEPVEEIAAVESISEISIEEQAAEPAEIEIEETPAAFAEEPVAVEEVAIEPPAAVVPDDVPMVFPEEAPVAQHLEPVAAEPPVAEVPVPEPPVAEHPAPAPGALQEFVTDLESSLGDSFLPGTVAQEVAPEPATVHASAQESVSQPELEPIGDAAPTAFGVPQPEVIGEFVADLEASLGDDFLKGAPVPEPATAQPEPVVEVAPAVAAAPHTPAPSVVPQAPVAIPVAAVAASAAAAASGASTISAQTSSPAPQQSAAFAPAPQIPSIVPGAPTSGKSSPFGEDAGIDLAEMFGELKQDLESGSSTTEEDPETHYNLGIAFREMGLLDEAIGELQKTCQAVDRGHPFPQVMQTYTWLAQCFLDKGVPEAAIRWYQKALAVASIDEDTRTALHYELAAAYEAAGDRPSALKHFMEVYGRNIDYRDVAERIKPLKS